MSRCRSCNADVRWLQLLPRGRVAPIDVAPSTTGNIRLLAASAQVLTKAELLVARAKGELLFTSHFATCSNAAAHRKTARGDDSIPDGVDGRYSAPCGNCGGKGCETCGGYGRVRVRP